MSPWKVKALVREKFGNKCADCGMGNREHLRRTGRGLHVDRDVPGGGYTIDGCTLRCLWCHVTRHGGQVSSVGRCEPPFGVKLSVTLYACSVPDLRDLAKHFGEPDQAVIDRALELLAEKTFSEKISEAS